MTEPRYPITLQRFAEGHTRAVIRTQGDSTIIHITDFHRDPRKAAKAARKWVKQRVEADKIAEGTA
jgi:hypothetical protein